MVNQSKNLNGLSRRILKAYMPTFQIPKKNGYRLITDCRKLDTFITSTPFKGPSAYEAIRRMQDIKFVAKLDLKDAYYNIRLDLKDAYYNIRLGNNIQKYLAFNYRGKDFTWTRIIQEISDGPTVFQRFLANILQQYSENVINYLDDIAIGANTMDEPNALYEKILKTSKENG